MRHETFITAIKILPLTWGRVKGLRGKGKASKWPMVLPFSLPP
jgi:hypothetical protein